MFSLWGTEKSDFVITASTFVMVCPGSPPEQPAFLRGHSYGRLFIVSTAYTIREALSQHLPIYTARVRADTVAGRGFGHSVVYWSFPITRVLIK